MGKHLACFGLETCPGCPYLDERPVKPWKKDYYVHYDDKALRIIQKRVHGKSPEFHEVYRFRIGIEGTMSQIDRKTRIEDLQHRGLQPVSFCAT